MKPLNEDAQIVIREMDFKNTDLEVTISIDRLHAEERLHQRASNSILISENKDKAKEAALQAKLGKRSPAVTCQLNRWCDFDQSLTTMKVLRCLQIKTA